MALGQRLRLRLEQAAQKVKAVPPPAPPLMIASESEMPVGTLLTVVVVVADEIPGGHRMWQSAVVTK